jgi:hypothetical protein
LHKFVDRFTGPLLNVAQLRVHRLVIGRHIRFSLWCWCGFAGHDSTAVP